MKKFGTPQGDLLAAPAHARHWFDRRPRPIFTAIRWFNEPDGRVGNVTGDSVAERFPRFE